MKRHCLCSKDANKCDRESRKISITALLSISLSFKWGTHSSHAPSCGLTGMQIVVGTRRRDSSVCDCIQQRGTGKKGTPERKQHSRWDWPLLSQIGWTLGLTTGDKRLEKLLLQHTEYHSAVQMKSLFANKLLSHTVVNKTAVLKDEMVALSSSGWQKGRHINTVADEFQPNWCAIAVIQL